MKQIETGFLPDQYFNMISRRSVFGSLVISLAIFYQGCSNRGVTIEGEARMTSQTIYNIASMALYERGYDIVDPHALSDMKKSVLKECEGRGFIKTVWCSLDAGKWKQPSNEDSKNVPAIVMEVSGEEYCAVYHGGRIEFGRLLLSSAFLDADFTRIFRSQSGSGTVSATPAPR